MKKPAEPSAKLNMKSVGILAILLAVVVISASGLSNALNEISKAVENISKSIRNLAQSPSTTAPTTTNSGSSSTTISDLVTATTNGGTATTVSSTAASGANITTTTAIPTGPAQDLEISDLALSGSGFNVNVTTKVKNIGNLKSNEATLTIHIYYSAEGVNTTNAKGVVFANPIERGLNPFIFTLPELNPGEEKTFWVKYTEGPNPGTYYAVATAIVGESATENIVNNQKSVGFSIDGAGFSPTFNPPTTTTLPAGPDLRISLMEISKYAAGQSEMNITVVVANSGTLPSSAGILEMRELNAPQNTTSTRGYVSVSPEWNAGTFNPYNFSLPSLAAGESKTYYLIYQNLNQGNYFFTAKVDLTSTTAETNENNNIDSRAFSIGPSGFYVSTTTTSSTLTTTTTSSTTTTTLPTTTTAAPSLPDFKPTDANTFTTSGNSYNGVTVTMRVENVGTVTGGAYVRFSFTQSGIEKLQCTNTNVKDIEPGTVWAFSCLTGGAGVLPAGTYTITGIVLNTTAEISTYNNQDMTYMVVS